jgi:uncharacterized protein YidB (DUF937 family)
MGLLDETLKQLTQSGNAPQPLVVVLQELLIGKPQPGAPSSPSQQQAEVSRPGSQGGAAATAGLGGLLAQLQAAGLDDAVRSWIGSGQNKPVQPDELSDALGKRAVTQMADKAGCSQDDFLTQLAKALPTIIDKLTQDGRVPTQAEVSQRLKGQ